MISEDYKKNIRYNIITPCYILDEDNLLSSIKGFKNALNKYFPLNTVGYSVKTNSLPFLLEKIKEFGCFAEVVSYDEYLLAKECGFPINKIIYNGPLKSKETFTEAIVNNAIVNIETKREVEWLFSLPKDKMHKVGIRLNVDLDSISPSDAKKGEGCSRFGYNENTHELDLFLSKIKTLHNVSLAGLHVHRTSKTRSVKMYKNISCWVGKIIQKYNLCLEYIDMGGGYYGIMEGKPTYEEYAKVIYKNLKAFINTDKTNIIVEPGNAIVASCFSFISEVIDTKKMSNYNVCTIDGSRIDIDPFFHKTDYFKEIIPKKSTENREILKKQIIGGCTCLEHDKLFTLENHYQLFEGDKILYKSVGAYTMTMTPLFIRYFPNIYTKKEDTFKLIREKWTAKNLIKI